MKTGVKTASYIPNTVADEIHQNLRLRICEGKFRPGEKISIRQLAQEFGTSVIPPRDAVRRLVAEGALEFADSRKIVVPTLSDEARRDVLSTRIVIEGEMARRAFSHLMAKDIVELKKIDRQIDLAIKANDADLYIESNYRFHFLIYEKGASPILLRLIEILWLQYGPTMRSILSKWSGEIPAEDFHKAATKALEAKSCPDFRKAIEADIEQGMGGA